MMRQRVVLVTLFLLAYTFMTMQAFQIMPQTALTRATRGTLEMKGKGKRVPIDQRGEFIKRQRMIDQRESMLNPQTPTTPGNASLYELIVYTHLLQVCINTSRLTFITTPLILSFC